MEDQAVVAAPEAPPFAALSTPQSANGFASTVLVIDDDPAIALVVREVFGETGISVVSASSGAEGLQAVASAQPDVVLLDVVLPDATGHELFERIRELDTRLPVIFVTADSDSTTAIEAAAASLAGAGILGSNTAGRS